MWGRKRKFPLPWGIFRSDTPPPSIVERLVTATEFLSPVLNKSFFLISLYGYFIKDIYPASKCLLLVSSTNFPPPGPHPLPLPLPGHQVRLEGRKNMLHPLYTYDGFRCSKFLGTLKNIKCETLVFARISTGYCPKPLCSVYCCTCTVCTVVCSRQPGWAIIPVVVLVQSPRQ